MISISSVVIINNKYDTKDNNVYKKHSKTLKQHPDVIKMRDEERRSGKENN